MSTAVSPVNFRDVGEALGLFFDASPLPAGRLFRGGRFDTMTTAADLGSPATILNLRRGPDPLHLPGIDLAHVPAADEVENYDTRQRRVRAWLGKAISVLAAPETRFPVYVHCTSGRDRTGVVIATVLLSLGIPRSIVAEEYLLSEGADARSIEQAIDGIEDFLPSLSSARARLHAALLAPRAPETEKR